MTFFSADIFYLLIQAPFESCKGIISFVYFVRQLPDDWSLFVLVAIRHPLVSPCN
jgi:hypothetical protein